MWLWKEFYVLLYVTGIKRYGDSINNTVEENSSIFSQVDLYNGWKTVLIVVDIKKLNSSIVSMHSIHLGNVNCVNTEGQWKQNAIVLGVFVEHDGQVLVDRQQLTQWILLDQFPGTTIRQHVAQSPVWVMRPHDTAGTIDPCLVTMPQDLSS